MAGVPHTLRRESLHVTVNSESLAFALRPRLEMLNRTVLLPIVERVLEEFDTGDKHVRIDHIDIDLGTIGPDDLARLVPVRFERELRDQVHHAIQGEGTAGRTRIQSLETARLEALEQYLLTGTLPFWLSSTPFDPDEMMRVLLATNPAAVARLFRRRGTNERLLRRTVLRLGEDTLRRLLHVLAPDDAAVVIVYMSEIRDVHAIEPLIPATDDAVARMLWVVALTYVLRDPGTQFNRTSLLRSLLEGLAASERWAYQDVLAMFEAGLRQTGGRLPIGSALLASITALVEQERTINPWFGTPAARRSEPETAVASPAREPRSPTRYEYADALRAYLRTGLLPSSFMLRHPDTTLADVLAHLPDLTFTMMQELAGDLPPDARIEGWHRLARALPEETLVRVADLVRDHGQGRGLSRDAAVDLPVRTGTREGLVREILTVLHGRADHDRPGREGGWSPSIDVPAEDVEHLQSVLTARAFGRAAADSGEPSSTTLLLALAKADAAETRRWLAALRGAGLRASMLVDEPPAPPALHAMAESLLPSHAAAAFELLRAALEAMPESERPGPFADLQAFLLRTLLDYDESRPVGDLIVEALGQLFGPSPTPRVIEIFTATMDRFADAGRIPAPVLHEIGAALRTPLPSIDAVRPPREVETPGFRDDDAAALAWLSGSPTEPGFAGPGTHATHDLIKETLERSPEAARSILRDRVDDPRARRRWVMALGEAELAQVVTLIDPRHARDLLDAAELLFAAWASHAPRPASYLTRRDAFWAFVLAFLGATRESDRSIDELARFFFAHVEQHASTETAPAGAASPREVIDTARQLAERTGNAAVLGALARDRWPEPARPSVQAPSDTTVGDARIPETLRPRPEAPSSKARRRLAFSMDEESPDASGEPIYITNAGLVLTAPFLPRMFQPLDMLESTATGGVRIRPALVSRAVHLLQWLVDGRTSAPEPLLCLNKLLCGVPIAIPIDPGIDPTAREIEVCTMVLRSVIANWTIISNTSIAGLQETFLQREGRLERTAQGWRLHVQRRTVDVLLDRLPWTLSTVVHSLMPAPIFVTW